MSHVTAFKSVPCIPLLYNLKVNLFELCTIVIQHAARNILIRSHKLMDFLFGYIREGRARPILYANTYILKV